MPATEALQTLIPHAMRFPRFIFGRFHRRHTHRHLKGRKVGGTMPTNQWWSDDDRWYERGTPPRCHNALRPLIDGAAAFEAITKAIKEAREYVYIVGWALTPTFALERAGDAPSPEALLMRVLADASERVPVKLLVWGGSTLLFQPTRSMTEEARDALLQAAPDLDCRLDNTAHATHCHHQKAIVVDGQVAFVGGLDLTTLEGDRWDVPGHPLRYGRGWHDVALEIRGEAVADVEQNFVQRWTAVTGETNLPHRAPQPAPDMQTPCQIVRTIPRRTYRFARRGDFGIAAAYRDAIARARRYIYLENQYLWSPEIVDALADALARQCYVVVVLPARADFGKYDNDKQVEALREADSGRGYFQCYSLYSGGPASGRFGFGFAPIYVHSKTAIIDDELFMIGSANLNRRGLAKDSEMNALAIDATGASALRVRLWAEHLNVEAETIAATDPVELIRTLWLERSRAVEAVVKRKHGSLPALIHPYQTGRMPGLWFLQELQSLAEGF